MFTFVNTVHKNTRWTQKTAPSETKPRRNTQNTHSSEMDLLPQFTLWAIHIWCYNFVWFQISFLLSLHRNWEATNHSNLHFYKQIPVFCKIKSHFCSMYVFLNHLIYVKMYFFRFLFFSLVTNEVFGFMPLIHLPL